MRKLKLKLASLKLILLLLVFNHAYLYAQEKDSLPEQYAWTLDEGYLIHEVNFDTTINQFHTFNPIEKASFSNSYLGNLGSEYHSNIFFDELEKPYTDFLPETPLAAYLMTMEKQKFYFSKKPYIELKYVMSTKKKNENNLGVIYTQNINKKWNVGLKYNLISSDGVFPQSKTSEHSLNFFTSYTGNKYSVQAAHIRNKFRLQESGGILPTLFTDPELSLPQINSASSVLYKSSFFVSQEYKFGKNITEVIDDTLKQTVYREKGKLNYVIKYEHNYRNYLDNDPVGFYRDVFLDSTITSDSVNLKLFDNSLYWTFREMEMGNSKLINSFGAGYEILKNYGFKGYVFINNGDYYQSLSAKFNSKGVFNKFRYKFNASYYLYGYKMNDYRGLFTIEKDFGLKRYISTLYLDLEISKRTASFMERYYYSNHFHWDNNFDKKNIAKAKFGFSIPDRKLKMEMSYAQMGNYIYFDSLAYPVQLQTGLNVFSATGQKEFKLGKFHSLNKVVWQQVSDTVAVSIPELALYHNLYLDLHYKTALHLHVGYELYYSTEFNALSFMPATGQFYQRREMKSGHFPIVNVYADARIQSVLLFIKFENVSFQFFNSSYYYLANNYPLNPTVFKFGVSWRFNN
ncbi:MAG: putative porin [Bacteroidota bacterium]